MYLNKEIEFKTFISEEKYNELIDKFGLDNNVFAQTNHYFDTDDTKLMEEKTVLRIRQKGNNYKITKKTRAEVGADETHILISKEKALEYLKDGFDANVIGIPYYVHKIAELTTYRVSTPYKNGVLFFDKSVYYDKVDYEIEFEVDDDKEGYKEFVKFMEDFGIEYKESIRKSKRAYDNRK
ncbi:MAG: CYTH domain-containing protein [Acholeplasmatales bacterium]|nr:CYTH domain-containing protein [Acholeplasmatales bacterium]